MSQAGLGVGGSACQVGEAKVKNEKEKNNRAYISGALGKERVGVTLHTGLEAKGMSPPGMVVKNK